MAKQIIQKVNQFNGGISDDPRKPTPIEFQIGKHFDIFSYPFRLTPYRSLESDTATATSSTDLKQYYVRDFVYSSTSSKLYGLGQTGAGLTKILQKADATTGLWTAPATSEGNGAVKNGCLFEYKDYLWGFQGTNQMFKWGLLSGTPSITNTAKSLASTITSVCNGIIDTGTGFAFVGYNNVIVRIETDTTTITEVTSPAIPSNYKITSMTNHGSYIAIGCSPISSYNGKSKVFLYKPGYDLFQETYDWGEGDLRVLESVDGLLIGVTDRYLNNTTGAGKGSMIIQVASGTSTQVIKEIFTQALTGKTIPISKAIKNNRLFWAAKIMTNSAGTEYNEGIWSFGRKNGSYPWALNLDIIDENVDTDGIEGFGTAANYFFIAHSGDGSVDKTNDAATYAFTSVYESQIFSFTGEDRLNGVRIHTAPLPASSTVTLKYKKNADTTWTTIGTMSTTNQMVEDFINIVSTGLALPVFQEISFRIESTGGAEITAYELFVTPLRGAND